MSSLPRIRMEWMRRLFRGVETRTAKKKGARSRREAAEECAEEVPRNE